MSIEDMKLILVLLNELLTKEITDYHRDAGICAFLDHEMYARHKVLLGTGWMCRYTQTWPHFSDAPVYPIPDPDGQLSPHAKYHNTENMWIGAYGNLRKDLVQHLIKEMSKCVTQGDTVTKVEIPNPTI